MTTTRVGPTLARQHATTIRRATIAAIGLVTLCLPGIASAQSWDQTEEWRQAADADLALAERYAAAYLALDFDVLSDFHTEATVFEDPAYGSGITGRDSIHVALTSAWAGATISEYELRSGYASLGGIVLLQYEVSGSFTTDGRAAAFAGLPVTLLLRVLDGSVVLHQDLPDYPCAYAQVAPDRPSNVRVVCAGFRR